MVGASIILYEKNMPELTTRVYLKAPDIDGTGKLTAVCTFCGWECVQGYGEKDRERGTNAVKQHAANHVGNDDAFTGLD